MARLSIAAVSWLLLFGVAKGQTEKCLCQPADACWPSDDVWSKLNTTVDGKLVETSPIGSPCHDPTYDAGACQALKAQWLNPLTQ